MKRATLLLEDTIYVRAKQLSRQRGATLKEVLNDLLRTALNALATKEARPTALPLHRRNGPQSGIDLADRNALYDFLDQPLLTKRD